jgi:hypothetical protein
MGSQNSERREVPRYPFVASAEQIDVNTGTQLSARVSELSLKGCYLSPGHADPLGDLSLRCHLRGPRHSDLQPAELGNGCSVQIRGTGTIRNPANLACRVERWQLCGIGDDVLSPLWLGYRFLRYCPIAFGIIHLQSDCKGIIRVALTMNYTGSGVEIAPD